MENWKRGPNRFASGITAAQPAQTGSTRSSLLVDPDQTLLDAGSELDSTCNYTLHQLLSAGFCFSCLSVYRDSYYT